MISFLTACSADQTQQKYIRSQVRPKVGRANKYPQQVRPGHGINEPNLSLISDITSLYYLLVNLPSNLLSYAPSANEYANPLIKVKLSGGILMQLSSEVGARQLKQNQHIYNKTI